ncbi:MAG: PHP domain-containing protein [Lachnospiraceae bacterium]|jgi:predicted metal-dependent phosphoesterase TrpH|nr:PHP domain-containing protein [Lachnospiraceae bacterium]
MIKADLHIHSRRSDGEFTYEELALKAMESGLQVIAFTDHYVSPDLERIGRLNDNYPLRILPGIECAAYCPATHLKAHILGYGIRDYMPVEKVMEDTLASLEKGGLQQLTLLQEMGYPITEKEARAFGEGPMFSQQFNDILLRKGVIPDMFGSWYQKMYKGHGPLKYSYRYPEPITVVKAIVQAGGAAVLAHPGQQKNYCLIPELADAGLVGLELIHPSNSAEDQNYILEYARERGLLLTGGSDFHGRLSNSGGALGEYIIDAKELLNLIDAR